MSGARITIVIMDSCFSVTVKSSNPALLLVTIIGLGFTTAVVLVVEAVAVVAVLEVVVVLVEVVFDVEGAVMGYIFYTQEHKIINVLAVEGLVFFYVHFFI